mgnify:CR=1 FL=1|tara:strand:- start:174 stop:2627 length:2454 start_codon:yes stop_codon:yes gene_type:complete
MPSVSKKQQKFMGIVRAIQKGEADPSDFNKDAQDAAKKMKKSSVKKYAKTKHKGLPNKKVNEGRVLHFTKIQDKTLEKHLKVIAKKVGATVSKISGGFKVDADNDGRKLAQVVDYIFDKSLKKGLTSGGGMSRVQVVNESNGSKRDYKAEYKKFQSSPKAKKYRAELNKYNRQKGTYGNGDGKDASHKGGKIVGFEKESTNRGRAEKSRLKKEINDYVGSVIDETINENPAAIAAAQRMVVQSKGKKISVNTARNSRYKDKDPAAHKKAKSMFSRLLDKFRKRNESQMLLQMAKQLKEADESVDEIKVWDLNEKCWKGYEKKGMKTMFGKRYPNCVKKKKKSESVNEAPTGLVKKAIELAKSMGGNMTGAIKRIEKMKKGLSKQKDVKKAIRMANESINETPYELGGMKVYSKADGLKKVKSMKKTAGAKIYKVTKTKTKLYGTNPVTMYNLHTKNKNHSTNSNPYGLDMMKGAYLIPVKESVNENISDSEKFKIYNSLKKGDIVSIKYDSSIAKGSKFHPFLVTKGKTKLMKGRVERIIMVPASGSKAKRYLYNRGGRISLALGDMAASIVDMKKGKVNESVNESKELTKIDKMLKDKIKQIGKKDKQRALKLMKIYKDHWLEFSIKAKQHMNEAFAIQYKKAKRYLTRKELFDKKPLKFKTEDEAKSMLNGLDYKYRTNYKIVKIKEGTCGYGMEGELGDEPAGPHLLKKKKSVKEARLDPRQLLQQLGGNRFIAMTGAKNLAVDKAKNTLHMKIGRNSKGVSHLRIKLTGADLYDMEFLQVRAGNVKVKAKETGLYADQLQKMFTKHTGMYTSL